MFLTPVQRIAAATSLSFAAGCASAQPAPEPPVNRALLMAEGVDIDSGGRPRVEVEYEKLRVQKQPADMGKLLLAWFNELEKNGVFRPQIVNPDGAAQPGEYPWMAALEALHPQKRTWMQFCGGVLIDKRVVLSAAHCNNIPLESIRFRLDVVALDQAGALRDYRAYRAQTHPQFARVQMKVPDGRTLRGLANDFALFWLNDEPPVSPLPMLRNLKPADLASLKEGRALGWGVTSKGKTSPWLLYIDVPIVDESVCRNTYTPLHKSMLCAGLERGGKDTCQGDSGGPFLIKGLSGKYEQLAVISFGAGCGLPKHYGIYSALREGMAWIDAKLAGK